MCELKGGLGDTPILIMDDFKKIARQLQVGDTIRHTSLPGMTYKVIQIRTTAIRVKRLFKYANEAKISKWAVPKKHTTISLVNLVHFKIISNGLDVARRIRRRNKTTNGMV